MIAAIVTPRRIQLSRRKGFRLADATSNPNGVVSVARPGKWGNPYRVVPIPRTDEGFARLLAADCHLVCDRTAAVSLFEDDLTDGNLAFTVEDVRQELAGKDLACWCPEGEPCHADVLLAFANCACQLCGIKTVDLVEHFVGDVAFDVCRDWRDCAGRVDAWKAVAS